MPNRTLRVLNLNSRYTLRSFLRPQMTLERRLVITHLASIGVPGRSAQGFSASKTPSSRGISSHPNSNSTKSRQSGSGTDRPHYPTNSGPILPNFCSRLSDLKFRRCVLSSHRSVPDNRRIRHLCRCRQQANAFFIHSHPQAMTGLGS